jgi:hypothetical protein
VAHHCSTRVGRVAVVVAARTGMLIRKPDDSPKTAPPSFTTCRASMCVCLCVFVNVLIFVVFFLFVFFAVFNVVCFCRKASADCKVFNIDVIIVVVGVFLFVVVVCLIII